MIRLFMNHQKVNAAALRKGTAGLDTNRKKDYTDTNFRKRGMELCGDNLLLKHGM